MRAQCLIPLDCHPPAQWRSDLFIAGLAGLIENPRPEQFDLVLATFVVTGMHKAPTKGIKK